MQTNNELDYFLNDEIPAIKEVEKVTNISSIENRTDINIELLKEHPKNIIYETKNDSDFNELVESIKVKLEHPIVINKENYILSGHRRFRAAKELGWKTIPFEMKVFNNEYDELEYILTENIYRIKTIIEKANEGILYDEIESLKAKERQGKRNDLDSNIVANLPQCSKVRKIVADKIGMKERTYGKVKDVIKATNKIDNKRVTDFIKEVTNNSVDAGLKLSKKSEEDIIKIKEKIYSGIKYKSITSVFKEVEKEKHFEERKNVLPANIKVYNDDCRNILKELPDNSIDMVLTDPPYAIDFVSSWKSNSKIEFNDSKDDILPLLNDVCSLLQTKCKKDAHLYFFSSWMSYSYFEEIISRYFDISNVIIWEKNNTSLVDFDKRYGFSYEQIIFCKQKGNSERMLKNKSSRDVIHFNRINNPDHTCEKPVDLLEYFIDNSTVENELVVDCFAGTFNSMVASRNLKRSYIGIEINNDFYKKGGLK